ncbi:restriction endonuclease [Streptomyces sp. NBC_00234]|uniref:restriction endonuclease n=1 Tax=Streptomyces sp. NBC_00234 TaxID=2903638 RepID=UPI002E2BF8D7|nr:restriction endonuclease [Streptomyces sp. NBC_00234]
MTHTVLHDPESIVTETLPLDREMHLALAAAVLAWGPAEAGLRSADIEQISLQLTGHARCVASDVRRDFERLAEDSELRPLTEVVLRETVRRLSVPSHNTVAHAQNRARLVRALYRALDRLNAARPTMAT